MNIFETVKRSVTPKMAAERYGLPVSPNGMARCPFHDDHHPSLKLYDDHFHCFGCQENGDVTHLTAKLLGLSAADAARKLMTDFGLGEEKLSISERLKRVKEQEDDVQFCLQVMRKYLNLLQEWKNKYKPQEPDDEPHDRYVEACKTLDAVRYTVEQLASGSREEQMAVVNMLHRDNKLSQLQDRLWEIDMEPMEQFLQTEEKPVWYRNGTFDEILFCEAFLSEHPMVRVDGDYYDANGKLDEELIKKRVYEMLRPYLRHNLPKRTLGIMEYLKMETPEQELPVQEDRIHVANGTVFLNGEFDEYKAFCRNRLPVRYDPAAAPPVNWLRFLSELLEEEDILTLQEYLGYCMIPTNRGQTMMLLKGNGGEGKSRIGIVMHELLGDNVKNGSIAKVEHNPFARADLEHQLLMVDDDMKMEALKSTDCLKSLITAETRMDLEKKGEQSYQGKMYARFLAFSNGDLESLYDHSDGFYRRQLILSVKKKPPNRINDARLADKLCAEIEGIFLWCLEGLQRLVANDYHFSESRQTQDNRELARQEADNVLLFLRSEGYIRLKADSTITSVDFYNLYSMWCSDNGYKPLAQRTVSMTLKKYAEEFGLEHDHHVTNGYGKRVNGFWGIEALATPRHE